MPHRLNDISGFDLDVLVARVDRFYEPLRNRLAITFKRCPRCGARQWYAIGGPVNNWWWCTHCDRGYYLVARLSWRVADLYPYPRNR